LSFGIRHLTPLWPRFCARYPDIELDISLVDRVVDLVEEGYDLAVRISRGGSPALVSRKLATTCHVVCASPDYVARHGTPASPEDLKEHVCIAHTYSDSVDEWRLLDDAGKEYSVAVRPIMRTNNGDTARAAARAGLAIVRQPTFLIGGDLRRKRLVPLLAGYCTPEMDVLAVYPSRRHLSAKVRVMVDFLAEAFRGTAP
jgi:DNA-binding transcriptional LysR family regulator